MSRSVNNNIIILRVIHILSLAYGVIIIDLVTDLIKFCKVIVFTLARKLPNGIIHFYVRLRVRSYIRGEGESILP